MCVTLQFHWIFMPYCFRMCQLHDIAIFKLFHVSHCGSCAFEQVYHFQGSLA